MFCFFPVYFKNVCKLSNMFGEKPSHAKRFCKLSLIKPNPRIRILIILFYIPLLKSKHNAERLVGHSVKLNWILTEQLNSNVSNGEKQVKLQQFKDLQMTFSLVTKAAFLETFLSLCRSLVYISVPLLRYILRMTKS